MDVQGIIAFLLISCASQSTALLFHGDGVQAQTTTMGPLGKDATLSLLVQEVLDLKTKVRTQEQEIQTVKGHQTFENNVTTSTLNQLMSEFFDIKLAFGTIKQEFDQTNNLTGLQAITKRLDNMAQSVRYLTLSQQTHEIKDDATNQSVYQELNHLNARLNNTDIRLIQEVRDLHNEIQATATIQSKAISAQNLSINSIGSSIATIQSILQIVNTTVFPLVEHRKLLKAITTAF